MKNEEVFLMMQRILATELIVRDLATCTAFYRDTLGLHVHESEADHTVFKLGDMYLFLLHEAGAILMMSDHPLAMPSGRGSRLLLAASVADVDALYENLKANGVTMLRAPADQPWGLRTAYFADPEGNFWDINQPVAKGPE